MKRPNVVLVHIYTHSIYPEKPIAVEGSEHKHNVISFDKSVRIDIPDIEFGYDIDTRDFLYKKKGGEWTPMGKEE